MENQEELKAHLIATDADYRALSDRHSQLKQELASIESKEHMTLEDEDREHEIKKQKLKLKDQMNEILSRHRLQQVA